VSAPAVTARHELRVDEPAAAGSGTGTVVLAHGAGAPMDSPFMMAVAAALTEHGQRAVRFEFPYMAARRAGGPRRPPNRMPELEACWLEVIEQVRARWPDQPVIGGKSLGGRVASRIADAAGVRGLVCLGYPFHPPGKPERTRTEHLVNLVTPALVVQGTRDPFGTPEEVAGYRLAPGIQLCWLEDGDHSFKPRRSSGHTWEDHLATAVAAIVRFVARLR
jgi:hypothetical protein